MSLSTPTIAEDFLRQIAAKPNAIHRLSSAAAGANLTNVKASRGNVFNISGHNTAAGVRYIKFFNTAGIPNLGSDPIVLSFVFPAQTAFNFNLGGQLFSVGIGYCLHAESSGDLTAADVQHLCITYY